MARTKVFDLLGVLPSRVYKGWSGPQDDFVVRPVQMLPYEAAFKKEYRTDAHFVGYCVQDAQGNYLTEGIPRLNIPAIGALAEQDCKVLVHTIAIDWDTKDHQPWTKELWIEFEKDLEIAEHQSPFLLDRWCVAYTTRCGYRWVYRLKEPVETERAREIVEGLVMHFQILGLDVDELFDWTRLFRLPNVDRDRQRTKDEYPGLRSYCFDRTVEEFEFPEAKKKYSARRSGKLGRRQAGWGERSKFGDPPSRDDVLNMVFLDIAAGTRTDFYKQAKRKLRGRECYPVVFEHEKIADEGKRNIKIFQYAGQVVSLCRGIELATPERCYALLFEAVEALDDEDETEPFTEQLWRAISTAWAGEKAQEIAKVKDLERDEAEIDATWHRVIQGAREWYAGPQKDDHEMRMWLAQRAILMAPGGYYILKPNGYYTEYSINKDAIRSTLRVLRMDKLLDVRMRDEDGVPSERYRPIDQILPIHGSPIASVRAIARHEGGGTLLTSPYGTEDLQLPMFRANPKVIASYDEEVDLWLRNMTRSIDDYEMLTTWLSFSLEVTSPICGLVIIGPPGVGKTMLALGLADCFGLSGMYTEFSALIGNHQIAIQENPVVVVNEGFPTQPKAGAKMADQIRMLISGDPTTVNVKFQPIVTTMANYRVLVTANNDEGLRSLYMGQDLTPDDREALAQRFVLINASAEGARHLAMRGGRRYTQAWVGSQSQYVLASHIRYLYEQRREPPGQRFLVEGSAEQMWVEDMKLNSGVAPVVVEALIKMAMQQMKIKGYEDHESHIWTTANAVSSFIKNASLGDGRPRIQQVGRTLKSIGDMVRTTRGDKSVKFYQISKSLLIGEATNYGFETPALWTDEGFGTEEAGDR